MSLSRCTGHCCKSFTLSSGGPYWTRKEVQQMIDDDNSGEIDLGDHNRQVVNMAIPIEDKEYADGEDDRMPLGAPYTLFTCKNFDVDTNDCKIYETRPNMCVKAGEDDSCSYEECTFRNICSKPC